MNKNITVLGAGSWGATLAALLSEKGLTVTLWEFNPEQAKQLSSWRALSFFPHLTIPKDIIITSDLKSVVSGKDIIVFAVPSHTLRKTAQSIVLTGADVSKTVFVSATKGIENDTLMTMTEIISQEIPGAAGKVAALSGPTHAEEVSQKIATSAAAASQNPETTKLCQDVFTTPFFRIYTIKDLKGVETGAALKNVFAIAAGICDGMGLGDNTKAALVTRGLRELTKLGVKMGGQPSTFTGLTGLGDLIVTCFSRHSRNRAIGEKIGKGKSIGEAEKELVMIAEGVKTAKSAYDLGKKYSIELPIIEQVYKVLYESKPPKNAVNDLMTRKPKPESDEDEEGAVL
jgi:glycerol-3-phosphate dehydrogenase (NAD(P)+)